MSCDDDERVRRWAEIADGLYDALRASPQAVVSIEGRASVIAYEEMRRRNPFQNREKD